MTGFGRIRVSDPACLIIVKELTWAQFIALDGANWMATYTVNS